jgi:hypothetical protein
MHHASRRVVRPLLALATLATVGLPATDVRAQELPDADDLIAAYVSASGGAERFDGMSSVTRGTFSMPSAGLQGTFELYQIHPDRMRMNVELPGVGEILSGYDGEHGWSLNPMMGPQLMSGPELTQMREQASVAATLRDPSMVPGRETVEEAEYEGEACWKVRLTWASGRETHDCYSKTSGLLVATEAVQATQMGDMATVSIFQDYRDFEGRMLASRMIQRVAGQEQIMTIETVEFGQVEEEQVAPPAQIRALIDG